MPEKKDDPRQRQGDQGGGEKPMQDDKRKGMGQGQNEKEGKNVPDEALDEDDRITQRNPIPRTNEEE